MKGVLRFSLGQPEMLGSWLSACTALYPLRHLAMGVEDVVAMCPTARSRRDPGSMAGAIGRMMGVLRFSLMYSLCPLRPSDGCRGCCRNVSGVFNEVEQHESVRLEFTHSSSARGAGLMHLCFTILRTFCRRFISRVLRRVIF